IYLHDNGWIQDPDSPNYAPRSKRSQYDGGVRTPILVRWPGHSRSGENEALAHSVDLAPTILAAAGLKPTKDMPGINLLDPHWVASRDAIFGEIFEHNAIDIHKPAANLQYRWIVEKNWKLIVPREPNVKDGKIELYDLAKDPFEKDNLAARNAEKVADLSRKLDAWWKP
ncbi:MAG TPA: sulfatase/phosphatase domain-containing protein, partial [Gemmata sp.]|nr:sulfatase/phosphatase domain-containing protein [Gemmata sp.]